MRAPTGRDLTEKDGTTVRWVWTWLVGVPVVFFVIALAVHAGQHGSGAWPYFLPLMIAGVLAGALCSLLAFSTTRHGSRPHEKA